MHRVVITGAGAVSSLGADLSSNFKSLSEGKSGISKIEFLNSDRLSIKIGGQIKNYNPDIHFTKQEKQYMTNSPNLLLSQLNKQFYHLVGNSKKMITQILELF